VRASLRRGVDAILAAVAMLGTPTVEGPGVPSIEATLCETLPVFKVIDELAPKTRPVGSVTGGTADTAVSLLIVLGRLPLRQRLAHTAPA